MIREIACKNGLKVILHPVENAYSANIGVFIKAGTINEENDNYGCAHFLEHMLFKGTARRNARELAEAIDGVGGSLNAYTSHEYTCFYTRTLPEDGALALDVLGDMIAGSVLAEEEIEKEKMVILEEISMYEDDPQSFVFDTFTRSMYAGSPLGASILGDRELVKEMDRKRLMAYYSRHYRPDNMILVITGAIFQELEQQIQEIFGALPEPDDLETPADIPNHPVAFGLKTYERENVSQTHFVMGLPGFGKTHPEYYSLMILSNILGGSPSSRLFQELREKRPLCYDIGSYSAGFRDVGELVISGGASPESFPEALRTIREITDDLARSGVSEDEFQRGRKQIKSRLVLGGESPKNILFHVGSAYVYHDGYKETGELLDMLDGITYQGFQEFVRTYFRNQEFRACILGPVGSHNLKADWEEIYGTVKS